MPRPKKQPTESTGETMATETNETTETAPPTNGGELPTKVEMIRQAIEARKRKPIAIQEWIFDKYGVTVTTAHISTTKANLRKKPGKKPRRSGGEDGSG